MKKCFSLLVLVVIVAFCVLAENNFKVENKTLTETPPIIIIIPPMNLSEIYSEQKISEGNIAQSILQQINSK